MRHNNEICMGCPHRLYCKIVGVCPHIEYEIMKLAKGIGGLNG